MNKDPELFRAHGGATPLFSLNGVKTWARVVDVYDGDTLTCVLPVFDRMYRFQVRMMGIDTCEIRSKNPANKERAIRARDRLIQLVTGGAANQRGMSKKEIDALFEREVHLVWLHCLEFDKYGRLLGAVYASDHAGAEPFSDVLVRERLAYSYTGDTKLTEEQQLAILTGTV